MEWEFGSNLLLPQRIIISVDNWFQPDKNKTHPTQIQEICKLYNQEEDILNK